MSEASNRPRDDHGHQQQSGFQLVEQRAHSEQERATVLDILHGIQNADSRHETITIGTFVQGLTKNPEARQELTKTHGEISKPTSWDDILNSFQTSMNASVSPHEADSGETLQSSWHFYLTLTERDYRALCTTLSTFPIPKALTFIKTLNSSNYDRETNTKIVEDLTTTIKAQLLHLKAENKALTTKQLTKIHYLLQGILEHIASLNTLSRYRTKPHGTTNKNLSLNDIAELNRPLNEPEPTSTWNDLLACFDQPNKPKIFTPHGPVSDQYHYQFYSGQLKSSFSHLENVIQNTLGMKLDTEIQYELNLAMGKENTDVERLYLVKSLLHSYVLAQYKRLNEISPTILNELHFRLSMFLEQIDNMAAIVRRMQTTPKPSPYLPQNSRQQHVTPISSWEEDFDIPPLDNPISEKNDTRKMPTVPVEKPTSWLKKIPGIGSWLDRKWQSVRKSSPTDTNKQVSTRKPRSTKSLWLVGLASLASFFGQAKPQSTPEPNREQIPITTINISDHPTVDETRVANISDHQSEIIESDASNTDRSHSSIQRRLQNTLKGPQSLEMFQRLYGIRLTPNDAQQIYLANTFAHIIRPHLRHFHSNTDTSPLHISYIGTAPHHKYEFRVTSGSRSEVVQIHIPTWQHLSQGLSNAGTVPQSQTTPHITPPANSTNDSLDTEIASNFTPPPPPGVSSQTQHTTNDMLSALEQLSQSDKTPRTIQPATITQPTEPSAAEIALAELAQSDANKIKRT